MMGQNKREKKKEMEGNRIRRKIRNSYFEKIPCIKSAMNDEMLLE